MDNIFNNREIASAIWLLPFVILMIAHSGIRKSLLRAIRTFLTWKIIIPLLSMITYMAIWVIVLDATGFWDFSALKDTVFWVFGIAVIMMFRATDIDKIKGFFKKAIVDNLKLIAILEFIVNIYTFRLWGELLLVPFLSIIVMLKIVAESKAKTELSYRTVDNFLGYLLAFIGIGLLGFTIYQAANDPNHFLTIHNLRDFLLPAVLSFLYLPFIYIWALILTYENIFFRINIFNKDRKLARYFKRLVLRTFHVRLWRLLNWRRQVSSLHVNSREDAINLVKQRGGERSL